ncbi:GNAT family N-acetyltransferase [Microbacterium sp. KR10-403]|uniref:GNAT family N-acetyltransferase n=1 Tax=Microbacterium sp. KR10-403 TaxID=3158581 RepID=UPI0032E43222
MDVTLQPWAEGDLPLLERANTPEMTRYIGGPEPPEKLVERNERYLRLSASGEAEMYRIEVDGEPAGGIGFWVVDHEGTPAYETGWNTLPEFQGRGVAREALRQLIPRVVARGDRALLVAYPGQDNPGSNALCRGAGFRLTGSGSMPWRGGELAYNVWELALSAP